MRRFASSPLRTTLLAACLALAPAWALAAKPGTETHVLEGTGGYTETALFDSADVLAVLQGETAWNPITGAVSMSQAEDLRLTYGLEVDDAGTVYAMFDARSVVTGGRNLFTGVVSYDETGGLEVVLARSTYYEDIGSESNQGEFLWRAGMDRVPTQDANATGDLQGGDFVISRTWVGTEVADNRNEIVLFRADASGQLVEERVLCSFDVGLSETAIQVAAGSLGDVYLWLTTANSGGYATSGLHRLSYDGSTDTYVLTPVDFPFETNQYFDTDDAGALYVQSAFSSDDQTIYQLAAGADPQSDATAYATYSNGWGSWSADSASSSGALALFLRQSGPQQSFVGLAAQGQTVAYADRIAQTEAPVYGMTADAYGSIYVAHEDREFISRNEYVVTAYTIYRLDPGTSDGGGNGGNGGGGNGGGKGKNK